MVQIDDSSASETPTRRSGEDSHVAGQDDVVDFVLVQQLDDSLVVRIPFPVVDLVPVGTELLSDYHASGAGRWTGRVYVPDQGRHFYSTIELRTPDSLRISGCILGGLICKRQDWIRK